MRAFVTGGTGFVGAHVVRALRARGDAVTCLVRDEAKGRAQGWDDSVRLVRGDLGDRAALIAGCDGADVVFHLAGLISAGGLPEFLTGNRDGTARVLEAAAAAPHPPRRFVYVSSLAAAGPTQPGHPIDETRPPAPVTDYGRSKLAGEIVVRSASIPWTIVRPAIVYGEGDRQTLRLFKIARAGFSLTIGDGAQELSIVYAPDAAAAMLAAAAAPAAAGRTYFAAHRSATTGRELALAVARAMDRRSRVVRIPPSAVRAALWTIGSVARVAGRSSVLSAERANEFFAPAWTCRSDALERDSGWRAATDLDTGLRRSAAWYRAQGWL